MIRTEERESGEIRAVCGASRSGKSESVKVETRDAQRLLVWDVRREYPADPINKIKPITDPMEFVRICESGEPGRYAYVATGDFAKQFEFFCDNAMMWLQHWPGVIVADEVGQVTTTAKAQGAWFTLVSQGAYWGGWIYGICQRTSEADKTLWGNATVKRGFQADGELDQKNTARALGLNPDQIPTEKYKFVEKHSGEAVPLRGEMYLDSSGRALMRYL